MTELPTDNELHALAVEIGRALEHTGLMLAAAESCTGGGVGCAATAVAGSSNWFERGFVTYSNAAKTEMLGVPAAVLANHGAVSEPTVRAMAEGALRQSRANVTVAITGIAGPTGGTAEKPVGTVWFAWAMQQKATYAERHLLTGDRKAVRRQSVAIALRGVLRYLTDQVGSRAG